MKKILALVLAAMMVFTFAACSSGSDDPAGETGGDEKTFVMKLAHDLSEDTPQHQGSQIFEQLVEENSGGRIDVQIFPAGQLGTDIEAAEMMQNNSVQAGLIPTAKLSGFHAPLQVLDLPYLFPSREVMYATLDDPEFKATLFDPMLDINLKGLSFWESGFKQFTANKELTKPSDFDGLKFRVMESPLLIAQYKALGANPVPIDFAETYNALQQKVVDGQENPLVSITKMKFYEVQTNMTISNHGYLAYAFLVSKEFWDSLPEDLQAVVEEAANSAAQEERQITINNENGYIQTIKDSGTAVTTLTDEQISVFSEFMKPVHEEFRDVIGSDVLNKAYELIEKHAK